MASWAACVAQVGAGGGDFGDGDRHGSVVGPLAGFPAAATDHGDLEFGSAGGLEFVRRAERVAGGRGQQDPLGAVISCGHVDHPFAKTVLLRKNALIGSVAEVSDMNDGIYRDSSGRTLADYPRPSVAVDTALLTLDPGLELVVLQVRRANGAGWALPGTFLHEGERLADAVDRSLRVKAGVRGLHPRQLHVFDDPTEMIGAGFCQSRMWTWCGRIGWRRASPPTPGSCR